MGQMVNRASRDKIPINLTKEEINLYIKRFQIIDKDRKGYVSINDIRRGLKDVFKNVESGFLNEFIEELHHHVQREDKINLSDFIQMMSAIKSGHVAYSRFAKMAEMEEEKHEIEMLKKQISVDRSGGGL
ncbi:hypothetical protein WDU94_008452 [Cyamophila willieti]